MALEEPGGRRRRLGSADKARTLGRDVEPGEDLLDAPVDKAPRPHILRFFLTPDDLGIAVALQCPAERFERERVELLDPNHSDPLVALLGAGLDQLEIDLAAAQHDA